MACRVGRVALLGALGALLGCGESGSEPIVTVGTSAEIGPEGGTLIAPDDDGFTGFALEIPAGALSDTLTISFLGVVDETDLPDTAERVGPQVTIEPAGTALALPAKLTLPTDLDMLGAYLGKPEDCKAWARSGDGWEKREAVAHGQFSVTVELDELTTVAAGVIFAIPPKTCPSCVPPPVDDCDPLNSEFCIEALPRPSNMTFLDDFASLRIVGRKVYWSARKDGEPTVLRYDLDDPGDAFVYPQYTGLGQGAIATKGRVAVKSENEVWATFAGYGNLRFRPGSETQGFDRPSERNAVGVMASGGQVTRFASPRSADSVRDVEMFFDTTATKKFLYNYEAVSGGQTVPHDNVAAQGNRDEFTLRPLYRGKARGFSPAAAVSAAGFWGYEDRSGRPGTLALSNFETGPAAFSGSRSAQVFLTGNIELHTGFFDNKVVTALQFVPRDVTYYGADLVAIVAGLGEVFLIGPAGELVTIALPFEPGMLPLRVEALPDGSGVLLVTRGPLTAKGNFYILRRTSG